MRTPCTFKVSVGVLTLICVVFAFVNTWASVHTCIHSQDHHAQSHNIEIATQQEMQNNHHNFSLETCNSHKCAFLNTLPYFIGNIHEVLRSLSKYHVTSQIFAKLFKNSKSHSFFLKYDPTPIKNYFALLTQQKSLESIVLII